MLEAPNFRFGEGTLESAFARGILTAVARRAATLAARSEEGDEG